jgi:hypothetical protein
MEDKRELQLEGKKKGREKNWERKEESARARERERIHTTGKKHKTHNRGSKNTTKT